MSFDVFFLLIYISIICSVGIDHVKKFRFLLFLVAIKMLLSQIEISFVLRFLPKSEPILSFCSLFDFLASKGKSPSYLNLMTSLPSRVSILTSLPSKPIIIASQAHLCDILFWSGIIFFFDTLGHRMPTPWVNRVSSFRLWAKILSLRSLMLLILVNLSFCSLLMLILVIVAWIRTWTGVLVKYLSYARPFRLIIIKTGHRYEVIVSIRVSVIFKPLVIKLLIWQIIIYFVV